MHTSLPPEHNGVSTAVVERLSRFQWQATDRRMAVGCGDVAHRRDGRRFVSIDAWHDSVFDQLAAAMAAGLPRPLHTLVDEADSALVSRWERAGFTVRQRIREYLVPTDPQAQVLPGTESAAGRTAAPEAGPTAVLAAGTAVPQRITIVSGAEVDADDVYALDQAIRAEVDAAGGPPLPVMPEYRSDSDDIFDSAQYTVAVADDRLVGLVRVPPVIRMPRIALVAVLTEHRRRGIARALLAHALRDLRDHGVGQAVADVDDTDAAAAALFDSVGGRVRGTVVELVLA
ncbi:GNAT family N-acetyltransferase [Nocardia stercoris]|uniref:GNAT family N-acetyltransferase n=1 Tax=Nocardia stercoris TaxID=2483361 RepID=A0A3M2KVQ6_9NOCA|nr:GNAT family N-acetyltransferase [Nocardia stercoris]RMI28293.1 GNAT family N-acetyltransferase [Nocardia stercoris]